MPRIGLIAGNGALPSFFLNKALEKGYEVYTLAIEREASPEVTRLSKRALSLPAGKLTEGVRFFTEHGVREAVMLGQVRHIRLLQKNDLDPEMAEILNALPDKRTVTVIQAIIDHFRRKSGVAFLPSTFLLDDLLLPAGTLVGDPLRPEEEKDVSLGRKVAETLSRIDVGLTVAVKSGVILALEAVEGTDLTIKRAGRFTRNVVVVKVSRPDQDLRFDLPVIGPRTLKLMARIGGRVLAVSSGTLVLEKDVVFAIARRYGITLTVF